MTETADRPTQTDPDTTAVVIDGHEIRVPKGTLIIRAAEQAGIEIPRFCDHPLLAPAGACRQCLVAVEGQRKLVTSCTMPVADDMVVATQFSSAEVDEAQRGIMEFLLINHPLDCPVCDKGGECPLQNQAMSAGRSESRFVDLKRTFAKPVPLSTAILLDRERCILCARCTRFSDEIAGDPLIDLSERGALQQVTAYQDEPFDSYFSGNTVQICPVGALTGTSYRFRARPFDLVSTPSVCEHCSAGCAQRTDHRRGKVMRRLAGNDPAVNEEWNCDKGRWAFRYARTGRIKTPLIRGADGQLRETSWGEALAAAADGLRGVPTAVLPGGRLTVEDAYAYSRFARTVLGTNDIDFRARAGSAEEAIFLAAAVAGMGTEVIYDDLSAAPAVLLAGLEPEEECPMIFLRLRRAVRTRRQQVTTIAAFASPGTVKIGATLSQTPPGGEAAALREADDLVAAAGSIILVGERLASVPGALSEALALAARTGARLAWVPRRAGERGAIEVGALPGLLPGGAPVTDPAARQRFAELWDCEKLPADPGRDSPAMLAALADGTLAAALIGGVELDDLPDPALARAALTGDGGTKPFLVSLELRHSEVTALADVVLPVAADAERAGTYVTWEGRPRPFGTALADAGTMPDARVLTALAARLDVRLDCADEAAVARQLAAITAWTGPRPAPTGIAAPVGTAGPGQAVLATWRMLLDAGALQDGDPELAGLAAEPRVLLSATTAADIGVTAGAPVSVTTDAGTITLPSVFADLPYRTVWLPMYSAGSAVHATLAARYGDVVTIEAGEQS